MPLIVPEIPRIDNISSVLGKLLIDDTKVAGDIQLHRESSVNFANVVFRSQLPDNVYIITKDSGHIGLLGVYKAGGIPIVIDRDGIIVRTG